MNAFSRTLPALVVALGSLLDYRHDFTNSTFAMLTHSLQPRFGGHHAAWNY
jgi:hypothetical protein